MSDSIAKGIKFIFLVLGVYLCFLCSAIFHEKLYLTSLIIDSNTNIMMAVNHRDSTKQ